MRKILTAFHYPCHVIIFWIEFDNHKVGILHYKPAIRVYKYILCGCVVVKPSRVYNEPVLNRKHANFSHTYLVICHSLSPFPILRVLSYPPPSFMHSSSMLHNQLRPGQCDNVWMDSVCIRSYRIGCLTGLHSELNEWKCFANVSENWKANLYDTHMSTRFLIHSIKMKVFTPKLCSCLFEAVTLTVCMKLRFESFRPHSGVVNGKMKNWKTFMRKHSNYYTSVSLDRSLKPPPTPIPSLWKSCE